MKKKILFMLINMNIGGTEKSLLNLLEVLPRQDFEITVLLLEEKGGFIDDLPNDINKIILEGFEDIKPIINQSPKERLLFLLKEKAYFKAFSFIFRHLYVKLSGNKNVFFNALLKDQREDPTYYDYAVAYAGPMELISYYIAHKVKAAHKLQWIHFDVDKIGFDTRFAGELFRHYSKLCVVSEEAKAKLSDKLPHLRERMVVQRNIISKKTLHQLAATDEEMLESKSDVTTIVTVGRLMNEKGQDLAVKAMKRLKEDGFEIKWYCLGDGNWRPHLEKLIADYGLEKEFMLLGNIKNPFPFVKRADIYVQPSRHEGYCMTLAEARYLERPIVTTDFTGAREQIIDGRTGLIVPVDHRALYKGIKRLIVDPQLRDTFALNLKKEQPDHSQVDGLFYSKKSGIGPEGEDLVEADAL
ncbi:glycosyltransferase [Bacillus sp. A301a_S52]|nr:glycosyltransferase [Bacillus sp. A301a_S52]